MTDQHPSDQVLAMWLETGSPAEVEAHLAACDPCTDRLDTLTDLGADVRQDLGSATAPGSDLGDRTTVGVRGRLAGQEAASVLVEVFALPFQVFSVLVGGTPPRVTAPGTGTDETADDDGERTDG